MECPEENEKPEIVFIGKDDGKEKRVSLLIEGKHGKIGIIRPDKASTEKDKQLFLESLARVAIKNATSSNKTEEAQEG